MYSDRSIIPRRKTREINVGGLKIGGNHPVRIQSMTVPKTSDVEAVVKQIRELEASGCELVRVTVNKQEAADALPDILARIHIPLIADIHFDYRMALEAVKHRVSCVRINPGNVGATWKVKEVISAVKDAGLAMRIGVNAGSLERELLKKYGHPTPEALVESALSHIALFESEGFYNFKVSIKSSDVLSNYRVLHHGLDRIGLQGSCKLLGWGFFAGDRRDGQNVLKERTVNIMHFQSFAPSFLFGRMTRMTFLPQKLQGP